MKKPRSASRLVMPILVIGFILVSVAEVWLLTLVGGLIGVPWTLTILVVEALVGAWLLRREGRKSWRALTDAYQAGRMPTGHLADAALVLTGGLMLILPGFLTDVIGLFLLLPATRPLARKAVGWCVARSAAWAGLDVSSIRNGVIPGEVVEPTERPTDPTDPDVISGEVE